MAANIICDCGVQADCTYPACQTFDKPIAVHLTPKIDETCDHKWPNGGAIGEGDERCEKCGLSFIRYVHSLEF